MTSRFINPRPQFLDTNGDPLPNGEVNFYESGTLVRKTTYSDVNLSTANANPVPLNADGSMPNCFYAGTARVVLTYDSGSGLQQRFDVDGVGSFGDGSAFDIWNTLVEYSIGALVEGSDGEYYRSITNTNLGNDPTSSATNWEKISFIRTWNANITYAINEGGVIGSDGLLYRSLQNANLNKDPTSQPTWWAVYTSPGIDDDATTTQLTITDTETNFAGNVEIDKFLNLASNTSNLTIASGAITVTGSYHEINTEGGAATDDLVTINGGAVEGNIIILTAASSSQDITFKDGTGNMTLNGDFTTLTSNDFIVLIYKGTKWQELSRSQNAGNIHTFTPALADAASGGNEASFSIVKGSYTVKDGRCFVQIVLTNVDTTGLTSGNDVYITGLPFASRNDTLNYAVGSIMMSSVTFSGKYVVPIIPDNTSYIRLAEVGSGVSADYILVSEISSGVTDLWLSINYEI